MKKQLFLILVVALGFPLIMTLVRFARLRNRKIQMALLRRLSFKPLGQPPARFRARSTRFALRSVNQTMLITRVNPRVAARSTGTPTSLAPSRLVKNPTKSCKSAILPLARLRRSTSS